MKIDKLKNLIDPCPTNAPVMIKVPNGYTGIKRATIKYLKNEGGAIYETNYLDPDAAKTVVLIPED